MNEWSLESVRTAMDSVFKRSLRDPDFRELAIKDAGAAIRKETGMSVPTDFKLRFVDNQGADYTAILPDLVDPSAALADHELEQVAGGGRCAASVVGVCGASITASVGFPGVGAVGGCV